jgi:chemotaxis protein MotC
LKARRLLIALAALTLPAFPGPTLGKEEKAPPTPIVGPPTPFSDMMLDVQRLQARMAKGDKAAYPEQRARLRAIGDAIAGAKPGAFRIEAERVAVVDYLLSGGRPSDIAKIVERGDFPAPERDLLAGAAGYASGREAEAVKLLSYDPQTQSLRLASQLAYAQSVLLTPKDARKALELLDLARLLAPGTLIEEAALRREILLVGDLREPARVAFLARQYVERFGASLYAGDFVRGLAAATIHFNLASSLSDLAKFTALLELMPPEQARAFLLAVSRASLIGGNFEVAAKAAELALAKAAPGSADEANATLYDLLARFPGMPGDEARGAFAKIAADKLAPADRRLLSAAQYVDERRYDLPPLADHEEAWREASVAAARSPDLPRGDDPAAMTIRRAAAAIDAAEALAGKEDAR